MSVTSDVGLDDDLVKSASFRPAIHHAVIVEITQLPEHVITP